MSSLGVVSLAVDEFEAIRLKDLEGFEQEMAAEKMGISQPTFHRVLESGRKKIADALVKGKAIRIEGGDYVLEDKREFRCSACEHKWNEEYGTRRPSKCPSCGSMNIHRAPEGGECARSRSSQREPQNFGEEVIK